MSHLRMSLSYDKVTFIMATLFPSIASISKPLSQTTHIYCSDTNLILYHTSKTWVSRILQSYSVKVLIFSPSF